MTNPGPTAPERHARALERLAERALAQWEIEDAELALIKMRENAVFRVDTPAGARFAVRVHRHGYHSDAELDSELQWMRALQAHAIDVPEVVPSRAGRLFEVVGCEGVDEPRQVDLFEWIEGAPLGSAGESPACDTASLIRAFRTIGELCARVHNQSSAWQPPAGFRRPAWDEAGLTGEQPLWGRFWELASLSRGERDLIERARSRVHRELAAHGKDAEGYGIIHADLTPDNVMVHGERVRLIDFDDAGFGWHLFEIATALYFYLQEPVYEDVRDALIAGYREHRHLSDEALERLPLFLLARGFTYLGWVHTRPETETAREMTPLLVEAVCTLAEDYLSAR